VVEIPSGTVRQCRPRHRGRSRSPGSRGRRSSGGRRSAAVARVATQPSPPERSRSSSPTRSAPRSAHSADRCVRAARTNTLRAARGLFAERLALSPTAACARSTPQRPPVPVSGNVPERCAVTACSPGEAETRADRGRRPRRCCRPLSIRPLRSFRHRRENRKRGRFQRLPKSPLPDSKQETLLTMNVRRGSVHAKSRGVRRLVFVGQRRE
jgi:hypothetical protein